jgi:hypothetical protein
LSYKKQLNLSNQKNTLFQDEDVQNLSIETMSMFNSLNDKKTYNYPLKQRNQPAVVQNSENEEEEDLDWGDDDSEPKEEVKSNGTTSEESNISKKEEKPKANLQSWKEDDNPTKVDTKQQTFKTFSLEDYRKLHPLKEENPKSNLQSWKEDEEIVKTPTKSVVPGQP